MRQKYVYEFDEETGEYFSRPANEFDGYDPNDGVDYEDTEE